MPRKLVIRDDAGNLLGKLGIPDDATDDEIAEAYETAKVSLIGKRAAKASPELAETALSGRQIKCMACGDIQPYEMLATHVEEVCRPRVEALERQALRR